MRTSRTLPRLVSRRLLIGGGALLTLLGGPVGAAAGATHQSKTPLQQGLAFYKGKTVTLIEGGGAGGTGDLWARALAQYMSRYLHANIVVNDVAASGGITGSDEAAAASPTGLTLGAVMTVDSLSQAITGTQFMNYNITRLAWITGEAPSPTVILANPSAHLTLSSIANSTSTIKAIVANPGSTTGTTERAFFRFLNAKMQYVSGYPTTAGLIQGFQRGDAPIFLSGAATAGPLLVGGQAVALATTQYLPAGSNFRQVVNKAPTFAKVFQQFPGKTSAQKKNIQALIRYTQIPSQTLILQTGVSASKVDAMRAAAQWAYKQAGFRSLLLSEALNPTFIPGNTAKADFLVATKTFTGLACAMKGTC